MLQPPEDNWGNSALKGLAWFVVAVPGWFLLVPLLHGTQFDWVLWVYGFLMLSGFYWLMYRWRR